MMDLDQVKARAQRHLDGMTVNRDAMARDVITLVDAIRGMQQRAAQRQQKHDTVTPSMSAAFDGIFGNIFKGGAK